MKYIIEGKSAFGLEVVRSVYQRMADATTELERLNAISEAMWLYCTSTIEWKEVQRIAALGSYCSMLSETQTHDEFVSIYETATKDDRMGLAWTYLQVHQWHRRKMELFGQTDVGRAWNAMKEGTPQEILASVPYNHITNINNSEGT